MQWILLVLGCITLATAAAARRSSWDSKNEFEYPYFTPEVARGVRSYEFEPGYDESLVVKTLAKRALSALSRWKSFGSLGLRSNAIQMTPSMKSFRYSYAPGTDFVSAETRNSRDTQKEPQRPRGQPLRFG